MEPGGEYNYVVTHSGAHVSATRGVPTAEDLALSLSRQPRFGGMCRRHWSVLDHSLYTSVLAQRDMQPIEVQLAALLHDAHEWTGDIPTHFKHPGQRQIQREQDWRIFAALFPQGDPEMGYFSNEVKEYDRRALLAEALVVGPPSFKMSSDVEADFGERPRLRDVVALVARLDNGQLGVSGSELDKGLDAVNVQHFLNRLQALQLLIKTKTTQGEPV